MQMQGREDVVHDDVPCLRPVREPGDSHQEAHPGEGPGHDPELLLPEEGVGDLLVKEVRGVGVGDGLEHPTERQGAPDGKHEDDEPDEVGSEEEDDHQDGGHGQEHAQVHLDTTAPHLLRRPPRGACNPRARAVGEEAGTVGSHGGDPAPAAAAVVQQVLGLVAVLERQVQSVPIDEHSGEAKLLVAGLRRFGHAPHRRDDDDHDDEREHKR